VTLDDVDIRLVNTFDEAENLMRWLGERRPIDIIGVDTESTGLDTRNDRVRLVQFGDAHSGWVIPFERWGGLVEEVIRRYSGEYVFHNAIF
jgi:DNA polymerase-1